MLYVSDCLNEEDLKTIGEFTATWAAFEQEFFAKKCAMKKINSDICNKEITDGYLENLTSELRKALITYKGNVYDSLLALKFRSDNVSNLGRTQTQEWLNEEIPCTYQIPIWVIFRIRCNMFHGEKALWNLHQQETVFKICIAILEAYIQGKDRLGICKSIIEQQ